MKPDQEQRERLRDEMLIDMARGIQSILANQIGLQRAAQAEVTTIGRLDGHIEMLKGYYK